MGRNAHQVSFLCALRSEEGFVPVAGCREQPTECNNLGHSDLSFTADDLQFLQVFASQAPEPKGPFRTKNATALNSVVFYYRHSFLLSGAICCLISFKNSGFKASAVVFYYRRSTNLLRIVNLLSVVFLVREGPLGNQRFRKGVGGRGLATNSAQSAAENVPQNCVSYPKRA